MQEYKIPVTVKALPFSTSRTGSYNNWHIFACTIIIHIQASRSYPESLTISGQFLQLMLVTVWFTLVHIQNVSFNIDICSFFLF
jgi:hypothetical protein